MVNRMVLNNLGHRPVRTMLSVIAVAVEVLLIISVVGLVTGMVDEMSRRMKGVGADILVQPPGSSFLTGLSSAPMPARIADKLAEVPHVTAVAPVLLQSSGGLTVIYGIEPEKYRRVTGGFELLEGREIQGGQEIMADDIYASSNKWRVGRKVNFWNHDFTVVGIVNHGKGARLFVPLATAQELLGAAGKASLFFARVDRQENVPGALEAFKAMLPGYNVRTMEEYTSLMTVASFPGLQPFVRVMIAISVTIGFLVIFLAMYTTVLERTREIGILKSLGASKLYIANLILREVILMSLLGIVVGIGASLLLRRVVIEAAPTISVLITPLWLFRAAVIALAGALIGALYPAWRAARQDPIEALAYE